MWQNAIIPTEQPNRLSSPFFWYLKPVHGPKYTSAKRLLNFCMLSDVRVLHWLIFWGRSGALFPLNVDVFLLELIYKKVVEKRTKPNYMKWYNVVVLLVMRQSHFVKISYFVNLIQRKTAEFLVKYIVQLLQLTSWPIWICQTNWRICVRGQFVNLFWIEHHSQRKAFGSFSGTQTQTHRKKHKDKSLTSFHPLLYLVSWIDVPPLLPVSAHSVVVNHRGIHHLQLVIVTQTVGLLLPQRSELELIGICSSVDELPEKVKKENFV